MRTGEKFRRNFDGAPAGIFPSGDGFLRYKAALQHCFRVIFSA